MKTRTFVIILILVLAVLIISGCATTPKTQEEREGVNQEVFFQSVWVAEPYPEFDLQVQILERLQSFGGDLEIVYEVENDTDFYVNEYTIEFKITEYDGEVSSVEDTNYDLAPGEINEYTIYTQVKLAPCSEEEWNESGWKYLAYVQVSNVIIHR